jgi:hypothetical protein
VGRDGRDSLGPDYDIPETAARCKRRSRLASGVATFVRAPDGRLAPATHSSPVFAILSKQE